MANKNKMLAGNYSGTSKLYFPEYIICYAIYIYRQEKQKQQIQKILILPQGFQYQATSKNESSGFFLGDRNKKDYKGAIFNQKRNQFKKKDHFLNFITYCEVIRKNT